VGFFGSALPRCSQNFLTHALWHLHHVVIPEPEDAVALRLQPRCSPLIISLLCLRVLPTIDFYDQLAGMPDKIRYVVSDRRLPAEMHSQRFQRSQYLPYLPFSFSRAIAQRSGLSPRLFGNRAMRHRR
jgi:hypothetical protein